MEQHLKLHIEPQVLILPPDSLMCNQRKCILQDQINKSQTTISACSSLLLGISLGFREHRHIGVVVFRRSWARTSLQAVHIKKNFGFSFLWSSGCSLLQKNAALPFHNIFIKLKPLLWIYESHRGRRESHSCSVCVWGGMFTPRLFVLGEIKCFVWGPFAGEAEMLSGLC